MKKIKNITVIGLGLIGGSLAMALKSLEENFILTGYDIEDEAMNIAKYRNIIDNVSADYKGSVIDADLIVIATPISRIAEVIDSIKDHLKEGVIITDVGSAKGKIVKKVNSMLPENTFFIGGHPMAGSENEGVLSARADLFKNAFYILTPTENTISEHLLALHNLFTKVGARVISMSPGQHDENVALISHLPHILSTNLVELVDNRQKELKNLLRLCAGGFRDMTRIAASNTKMWLDITLENREELIKSIDLYIDYLNKFKEGLSKNNADYIGKHYVKAREARINLPKYVEKDISKLYELKIAIPDRSGVLSDITLAISSKGINIEDISIFHSTEFSDGGILKLLVIGNRDSQIAKEAIENAGFDIKVKKVLGE
ncbi:MAG: prephenate dehydrogenase [Actinomycetia bacterium]|nr:prephenate dehydrogenase [Actinomycetes bacterium]